MSSGAAVRACMRLYHLTVIVVIALDVQQECWRMSRPRGLPHSIRHTGIECTFLPEVYMYTTLARTHTHGHETASLRSVMSGAVTRTTENKSAMAFEHSGMPSFAPGDSVLESQGADGLRTAKLSQNSDIGSGTPTKCRAQVLPAELSDSNMLSSVPGDSALESQGAGGLRTAKLSQFFGRRPRCSGRATSTGTEWPNPHLELPAVDSLSKWR